jgi:fimbrial chaperone protein
MVRLLALLAAIALAAPGAASAQSGGVRVAPVLVSLSPERSIGSVRLHNGRPTPISFEVDAFAWSQLNGVDQLTPTRELIVAPGVFEIPPGGEQTIRLGARNADANAESAYRILLRELPTARQNGLALGFALEMSLPVFVTPRGAEAAITSRVEGQRLILTNTGRSFTQIALIDGQQRLDAPRYLLAGASAEIVIPTQAPSVRLLEADAGGHHSERAIHVGQPVQHASVR